MEVSFVRNEERRDISCIPTSPFQPSSRIKPPPVPSNQTKRQEKQKEKENPMNEKKC